MKLKTKKKLSYKGKALQRSASSWGGAYKMLQLLQRADINTEGEYQVSSVVACFDALDLLSTSGKI